MENDSHRDLRRWLKLYADLGVRELPLMERTPPSDDVQGDESAKPSPSAALAHLREHEIGECRRCPLHEGRRKIVFGVGNARARLFFVGEGPGADEDRQGEPFVGRAGQLLDRIIAAMGLEREEVYIANVVKCRPPGNRAPLPDESARCLPFLERQIEIVAPEVIVTLGRVALEGLLGESVGGITRVRGTFRQYRGIPLMPTFHPAYLLRSPEKKRPVWEDMQAVMSRLGLTSSRSDRS